MSSQALTQLPIGFFFTFKGFLWVEQRNTGFLFLKLFIPIYMYNWKFEKKKKWKKKKKTRNAMHHSLSGFAGLQDYPIVLKQKQNFVVVSKSLY
jgi:hypothetical protein